MGGGWWVGGGWKGTGLTRSGLVSGGATTRFLKTGSSTR